MNQENNHNNDINMPVASVGSSHALTDTVVESEMAHTASSDVATNSATHEGSVSHESTLYAEPVFHIGHFTITNALLTSWIAVFLVFILVLSLRLRKLKLVPGKLQNFFELIVDGALNLCDQVTGKRELSLKIFPISFSLFIFVLINNWVGILPGVGAFGHIVNHDGHSTFIPMLRGATADVNTTLAIALFTVIASNVFGIVVLGLWKGINKYVKIGELLKMKNFMKDPTVLVVAPIHFFVGLLEAVGEIAKVASLSFRLYGNVFAGEVLLASMSALLAYFLPIPFLFLEFFVGIIQAFIFAMLTTVYFSIQATDHDDHDSHESTHHDENHLPHENVPSSV